MKKLNFHIEQADNGILVVDRTDLEPNKPAQQVEVAYDKDIPYLLGKMIWGEIKEFQNESLANSLNMSIRLTETECKL